MGDRPETREISMQVESPSAELLRYFERDPMTGEILLEHSDEGGELEVHTLNHQRVYSGALIHLSVDVDDVPKMKLMIDLQWACLRLMALSGAAEPPTFTDIQPPRGPLVLESHQRVQNWVEHLPANSEQSQQDKKS